jgi:hypothetical protein
LEKEQEREKMREETLATVIAEEFGDGHLYSWLFLVYLNAHQKTLKPTENPTSEFMRIHKQITAHLQETFEDIKRMEKELLPEWVKNP